MMQRMETNPGFFSVDSDYKETRPQMRVQIDRARASDLGVSVTDIGRALETMMGSRQVPTFVQEGEEYDVLVQAGRAGRAAPDRTSVVEGKSVAVRVDLGGRGITKKTKTIHQENKTHSKQTRT